tara:strand:+ start:967 stop:1383 length:417 start_codon:yes stop_codon:yes gene_type:complete
MRYDDLADKEINKIVFQYYLENYKDSKIAIKEYAKLNMILNKDNSTKIIRIGNIVFLLNFNKDDVEFHSMGHETSAFAFIRCIYKLIDYVQGLKVRSISTYGNDPVFEKLYERVLVSAKKENKVGPDGMTYNYYRLEF